MKKTADDEVRSQDMLISTHICLEASYLVIYSFHFSFKIIHYQFGFYQIHHPKT